MVAKMKIYSVDHDVHHEGSTETWLFLSLDAACVKFEELCKEQGSSTSISLRESADGEDLREGLVRVASTWSYGEKSAKRSYES
jgi:hypothetical protein